MNDELMTSSQAAELAGTTRQTILFWLRTGHLAAVHVLRGGQRRPLYLFARQAVLTAHDQLAVRFFVIAGCHLHCVLLLSVVCIFENLIAPVDEWTICRVTLVVNKKITRA